MPGWIKQLVLYLILQLVWAWIALCQMSPNRRPTMNMSRADFIKILKGAGIAAIGAVLTYGTTAIANVDFGSYTPMVVAGWSVVVNIVRKFILPSA